MTQAIDLVPDHYLRMLAQWALCPEVRQVNLEVYEPKSYDGCRVIYQTPPEGVTDLLELLPLSPEVVLGVSSTVTLDRQVHFPMFDIDTLPLPGGVWPQGPSEALRAVETHWPLLLPLRPLRLIRSSADRGGHIIAGRAVYWADYAALLGRVQGVDPRFVYWSRARQYGTLRMTPGGVKTDRPELAWIV